MSNEIQTANQVFNFNGNDVRTIMIDNEVYFVGKDVANILGYTNPQEAIRGHVDEEDKGVRVFLTPGGKQNLVVINESGLYSLVLSSKLPNAKAFKRWVTSEVLPSIQKHGVYATSSKIEELLNDPDTLILTLTKLKEERKAKEEAQQKLKIANEKIIDAKVKHRVLINEKKELQNEIEDLTESIIDMEEDIEVVENFKSSKSSIDMKTFAALLSKCGINKGRNDLFAWLRQYGYLSKDNLPYQQYINNGYFTISVTEYKQFGSVKQSYKTLVTTKGQVALAKKIAKNIPANELSMDELYN